MLERQRRAASVTIIEMMRAAQENRLRVWARSTGMNKLRATLGVAKEMQLRGTQDGERVWQTIYGLLQQQYATGPPRDDRPLIVGGYIGRGVEQLRIPALLADPEVASLLPAAVRSLMGKPLFVFKYHVPLMQLICNWAAASRGAGAVQSTCRCREAQFAPFCHGNTGHVITKDPNVARSPELRELLKRGMNYRLRPVSAKATTVSGEGDAAGASACRDGERLLVEMVETALGTFGARCEDILGISRLQLAPWEAALMQRVKGSARHITDAEAIEIEKWHLDEQQSGWSKETAAEATALKRDFVIAPADKETGTFVFACRQHWEQCLWQEVRGTPTYQLAGTGAQQFVLSEESMPVTEVERRIRTAPRPPPLVMPTTPACERVLTSMEISESMRIGRATHLFGVIGVPVWSARRRPAQQLLEECWEDTMASLEAEERMDPSTPQLTQAFARARQAGWLVRSPAAWQRLWDQLRETGRPTTRTLSCPVDVDELKSWAASPAGQQVVVRSDGSSTGVTGAVMVRSFLFQTREARQLTLSYRHSTLGADAVAAGFMCESREYSDGPDPFKLRSMVRGHALAKFGYDVDDCSSFPTALRHLVRTGAARAACYLADTKLIRQAIGDYFFGDGLTPSVRYDRGKRLINLLDMDGTFEGWLAAYRSDVVSGRTRAQAQLVCGSADRQVTFDLGAYITEQPARTLEMRARAPRMFKFFRRAKHMGERATKAKRTMKSYVLQECEGISRRAKLAWCETTGAKPLNLQHDGVVIMLPNNRSDVDAVTADIQRHCSALLGYTQRLEVKPWGIGVSTTERVELMAPAPTSLTYVEVLRAQCQYAIRRRMVKLIRYTRGAAWTAAGVPTDAEPADDDNGEQQRRAAGMHDPQRQLEAAINRYKLPYLYGTVKTHKTPYGWRYIAGGREVALNLISDWVHRCLAALLPDVHALARDVLMGLVEQDPTPCHGSFIIKDSRDVVSRIHDLERRRRQRHKAFREGRVTTPPTPWREVGFGVHDFTTLYPLLPHDHIKESVGAMIDECFARHHDSQSQRQQALGVEPQFHSRTWKVVDFDVQGRSSADQGHWKYFSAASLREDIEFILDNTYCTVGDEIHKQIRGVPMGLSCSPMLAVIMLACYEIRQLRRMRDTAQQPVGSQMMMPRGAIAVTRATRLEMLDLAARFSRCCRAIDDVLLIDLSVEEQAWLLRETYPAALELKMVCQSPGTIEYLDMEIRRDHGGFYTTLYDKRDALRLDGKMDAVRRFPHPDSMLSNQCKYATLTTFLHRAHRVCVRRKLFIRAVVTRVGEMTAEGYDADRLRSVVQRFVKAFLPRHVQRYVVAKMRHMLRAEAMVRDGRGRQQEQADTVETVSARQPRQVRSETVHNRRVAGTVRNEQREEETATAAVDQPQRQLRISKQAAARFISQHMPRVDRPSTPVATLVADDMTAEELPNTAAEEARRALVDIQSIWKWDPTTEIPLPTLRELVLQAKRGMSQAEMVQYFREQELDPEWVDEQWEPVAGDESNGEEYIAVQADELEEWLERVMEREPLMQLRRLYTRRNGGAVSIGDVYKEQTDGTRELVARLMASGTFKWFELVDY